MRFLAARSQYGYTDRLDRALFNEPEAVAASAQAELTAHAHRLAELEQRQQWEALRVQLQRQIDWLYSQRLRREVRSSVRALERQIARLDALLK
jgi:hypothetical protein